MARLLARIFLLRDNEIGPAAYFVAFFLLIGIGTALGRGTTDALFFKRYGIDYLPPMYALLSVLLALVSIAYAAVADRLTPERFFRIFFFLLIVLLIASWLGMRAHWSNLIYPFYFLLYEIVSELLLVHAALYLSLNFDALQSKRIGPLAMAGGQLGLIAGGLLLATGAPVLGVENILLVWATTLGLSMLMLELWHRAKGASPFFRPGRNERHRLGQAVSQVSQGLKFMRASDLLRAASYALFFMVIAFYVLSYAVNRIYTAHFSSEDDLTAFFGLLTVVNGSVSLLLQVFVTNRMIDRAGVKKVNLVFPVSTIFSYAALLFSFTLPSAVLGSFNKDTMMSAFRNPVRNLFFNALPGHMQGRGRATSVVVVMPLALAAAGLILWAVERVADPAYFLVPGLIAALVYLHFNRRMNRVYAGEIVNNLRQKLHLPDEQLRYGLQGTSEAVLGELERGVGHADDEISLAYAKVLSRAFPERATQVVFERLATAHNAAKDRLLNMLMAAGSPGIGELLWRELGHADDHLRATMLRMLFRLQDRRARSLIVPGLRNANPRLRACAVEGVMLYGMRAEEGAALEVWRQLIGSDDIRNQLAALPLLAHVAGLGEQAMPLLATYPCALLGLLGEKETRVRLAALHAIEQWPGTAFEGLAERLLGLAADPEPAVRVGVVKAMRHLRADEREWQLAAALEDSHPQVRSTAARAIFSHPDLAVTQMRVALTSNRGSPRAQQAILDNLLETGAPSETLEQIALAKVADAHSLAQAFRTLRSGHEVSSQPPSLELLGYVLEERVRQSVDLALAALQPLEDAASIGVIRAGFKSGDTRHLASACEALRNLSNRSWSPLLADVVETLTSGALKAVKREFADARAVLNWCSEGQDPWLRTCAAQALQTAT